MEDERQRRISLNETVFRQANEQIQRINEAFAAVTERMTLVCECGDTSCTEQIEMSGDEYEQLRSESTQFAVKPGHEIPDVEDVVRSEEGYDVVRKRSGVPAEVAEATDPRT